MQEFLANAETWVGVGTVKDPLPESTRAGSGPAFVLAREAVPACRLGGDGATGDAGDALPLGYTTWLATRPLAADPGDTVLQL